MGGSSWHPWFLAVYQLRGNHLKFRLVGSCWFFEGQLPRQQKAEVRSVPVLGAMDERLEATYGPWTGVVEILNMGDGQRAKMESKDFDKFTEGDLVTLYDVRRAQAGHGEPWMLDWEETSKGVVIPCEDSMDFRGIKDICAGMGGITQGLEMAGFYRLASLDNRTLMCEIRPSFKMS